MAEKWAQEPWKAAEGSLFIKGEEGWGSVVDAHGWFIAKLEDSLDPEANGARIVACVNALAGLDPGAVGEVMAALEACAEVLEREAAGSGGDPARRELLGRTAARARTGILRVKLTRES